MKKVLLIILILTTNLLFAQTTHRIVAGMNLQTEMNNATGGDVFYVEGGIYGNLEITKKVILIGTGFFLTQTTTSGLSTLGNIKFLVGSEGSWITGFRTGGVNISTSNIMVERNYTGLIRLGINGLGNAWDAVSNNCVIKQNFGIKIEILSNSSNGRVMNFSLKNNIFSKGLNFEGNIGGETINNTFNSNNSPEDSDNYYGGIEFYDSRINGNHAKINVIFKNNIMTQIAGITGYYRGWCPVTYYTPDIFLNNIVSQSSGDIFQYGLPTTNLLITDLNTLYIGYPNNSNSLALDARNQLTSNSPAKRVGENGTDAGAFGGDEPYVLSGIPSIPTIYQLTVPSNVPQGGTLNVQIKAKINN